VKKSQVYYLREETDMLIEFSVGNYRSFKEKVTFSMVAANLVSQDKNLDINNVFTVDDELSLLKSAAIYGANASGKSNLAKALGFMRWFMVNSSKETQSTEEIGVERFRLSTETDDQPSFFEIVFLLKGQQHRYGFKANHERIVSEWLFYTPKKRETKLFSRQNDDFKIAKVYRADGISQKTRDNALFLSVSAQFNVKKSESILDWITYKSSLISGLNDDGLLGKTIDCLLKKENHHEIIDLLKNLDLGITEIEAEQIDAKDILEFKDIPEAFQKEFKKMLLDRKTKFGNISTMHQKFNQDGEKISLESFDLGREESDGTQKVFALAGLLVHTLKNGNILIIDEFDARLHPLMSQAIVKMFNSKGTNPNNAQLIFMTHDTNLLSNKIFRRDQVWFTDKNRYGATNLYSLAEYRNVRNDASFGSDYIKGKYGAIPYIQGAESLIEVHV
jgi:AAA15 family ATPase/GTPase